MIKVGILGAGRVAQHYKTIMSDFLSDICCVVAVCDLNPSAGKSISDYFDVPFYSSLDSFLDESTSDIIFVLTPSGLHFEHASKCLLAGYHVLVEKPVTMNLADAKTLDETARKTGRKVCVAFQNRYNASIQYLKKVIDGRFLGQINLINLRLIWCREQSYYEDGWHGTWNMDGGVCNQQAIHHLDILATLFGPITKLCAHESNLMNSLQAEDTMLAIVEFESGAVANISLTTAARPKDIEAVISISGSKGNIQIGGIAINQIDYSSVQPSVLGFKNKKLVDFSEEFSTGYGLSHRHIIEKFCAAVEHDTESPVSICSTFPTIKLVHALYSSNEDGGWVVPCDATVSKRLGRN